VALSGLLIALAVGPVAACRSDGSSTSSSSTSSSADSQGVDGGGVGRLDTTYTVDQAVRTITLDGRAGKVSVTAEDGPVTVTERARYTDGKPVTSHDVSGDTLRLREDGCPDRPANAVCQVGWEVTAPAGTALTLQTGAGGIELRGMAGEVTARTRSGGVEGRDLTSRRLVASSNAGGVELEFREPPDLVEAENNAGGVELTLPADVAYAVDTGDTRRPEVEVRRDDSSPHKVRVEAGAGGVEVKAR
jgi:hypothetical protein